MQLSFRNFMRASFCQKKNLSPGVRSILAPGLPFVSAVVWGWVFVYRVVSAGLPPLGFYLCCMKNCIFLLVYYSRKLCRWFTAGRKFVVDGGGGWFMPPSTCGFGGSRRIRLAGLWRRRIRRVCAFVNHSYKYRRISLPVFSNRRGILFSLSRRFDL